MNDKDTAVRLSFLRLLPSIIVVFTAAIALPFASVLYVGAIASSIFAFFLIATAKKKIPVLLMLLLLVGTFGLPSGLPMITILLALIVGTGTYSWLISYTASPYIAIIPVLAYSIATVITQNWFGSLITLSFAIPSLVLALCLRSKTPRLASICRTSASFLLITALAIVLAMFYFRGEFRFDVLRGYANDFTRSITDILSGTEMELINGETEALFTPDEAYNMAARIVSLFPAIAVIFFNTITFFAQRLQFSLTKATLGNETISGKYIAFIASPFAGIVYVLSFLISTLTNSSPSGKIINTVCQNLFVILTPALIGMGIMFFFANMAVKKIRFAPVIIIAVLVLLFINTQAALLLVSCFGAYASVAIPILTYYKEKTSKD